MKRITIGGFLNVCQCKNCRFKIIDNGKVIILDLIYGLEQNTQEHIKNYDLLTNLYSDYYITKVDVEANGRLFVVVYGR